MSNKIAVNTIIMYFRMLLLIVIAFYSSRLLLQTLGVRDFGIQSVVGSISSTFISLKSLFSESVQRYLNHEKGLGSLAGQIDVFNVSVLIHVLLAILFVIVAEPVGCWIIQNKLDIPVDRISTAFFIFHLSVISIFISIFSIPLDAIIISNEKMGIYAFVTIMDAVLRLVVVILLGYTPYDKLKTYSVLLLFVPLFTLLFQLFYCRKFPEYTFQRAVNRNTLKGLISLSGWNFFGNISFSMLHEGVNMLLNVFGGLIYNAARTISYQVRSVSSQLATNTMIAVRPRVMQQAAIVDRNDFVGDIITISRIAFFTTLLPTVALFTYTEQLLNIWLDEVPAHTVLFTRLILISVTIRSLHEPLNMMYMAYGNIKRMTCVEMFTMLSVLFLIYLSLKAGAPLWFSFIEMGIMECLIIFGLVLNAKYEYGFQASQYFKKVVLPLLLLTMVSSLLCYTCYTFLHCSHVIDTLSCSFVVCSMYSLIVWFFFDQRERNVIYNLIRRK